MSAILPEKKAYANILLAFVITLLSLVLSETALRFFGGTPGVFQEIAMFHPVDSLIVYENYSTDSQGIYKFSNWTTDSLYKYYSCETRKNTNADVKKRFHPIDDVEKIYGVFCDMQRSEYSDKHETIPELNQAIGRAKQSKQVDGNDDWKNSLLIYSQRPYNAEGFRGIPCIKFNKSNSLRIMLVGDSFVYGYSAEPIINSFSDILLARGYLVYNFGIPGTDPAQYAEIVRHYAPLLKPDLVIVCFYPGNDLMGFYRTPCEYEPPEHITNAGLLNSNVFGTYYSAQKAYNYYFSLVSIPDTETNAFNALCSSFSIGTLLWKALLHYDLVKHPLLEMYNRQITVSTAAKAQTTKTYVAMWEKVCAENNIPLLNVLLPCRFTNAITSDGGLKTDSALMNVIFGSNYYAPKDLMFNINLHYDGHQDHINNAGCLLYAAFLDSLIREQCLR